MSSLLTRIAVFSARHRLLVIGAWAVLSIGLAIVSHAAGARYDSTAAVAGSNSQKANDLMARAFMPHMSDASPIVFHASDGTLLDPGNRKIVESSLKELAQGDNVASVSSPFSKQSPAISRDGSTAFATVVPSTGLGDLTVEQTRQIYDAAAAPAAGTDVEVQAGGQLGTQISKPPTESSELIGIVAAMLILALVFGTVTAMALPIVSAITGVICGLSLISLLGHAVAVPSVAPTVATMIGLGVGIDYSLFIVTRARSARFEGLSVPEAIGHAAGTSGGAVAFAGGTVVIALLSLGVSGLSLITVLGQASAIVVVVAVLASMTLLPALLGLCGDRIESLRIGSDKRPTLGHSSYWERWGTRLSRRPGLYAAVAIVALLALASPVHALRLGLTDQASDAESTTARQAYDLLTHSFGPGSNGTLMVAADLDSKGPDDPRLAELYKGLEALQGVQNVAPPQVSKDGGAALLTVIPKGSPTSDATSNLVTEIRDRTIPASGITAYVGGSTAQQIDLASLIGKRLPLIIAVVVGLSMLLLLVAFRSVIVPLQAAMVNLLAVGAAYGVVTAVFQDGEGAKALGLIGAIPIVSYVPMMMFAILFGLAMDYQVFLISRVREEVDAGKSPRRAVIDGLASSGKVIASAATIMVAVFSSFILNGDPTVKEFGVGLASAVLVAGSMVCVLLPAVMLLMGERTWWLPRWLDRLLPHISVEGSESPAAAGPRPQLPTARRGLTAAEGAASLTRMTDREGAS